MSIGEVTWNCVTTLRESIFKSFFAARLVATYYSTIFTWKVINGDNSNRENILIIAFKLWFFLLDVSSWTVLCFEEDMIGIDVVPLFNDVHGYFWELISREEKILIPFKQQRHEFGFELEQFWNPCPKRTLPHWNANRSFLSHATVPQAAIICVTAFLSSHSSKTVNMLIPLAMTFTHRPNHVNFPGTWPTREWCGNSWSARHEAHASFSSATPW